MSFLDRKSICPVNRNLPWELLEIEGFWNKTVDMIKRLYQETKIKVRLWEVECDWVESVRGVRQGCAHSPALFAV